MDVYRIGHDDAGATQTHAEALNEVIALIRQADEQGLQGWFFAVQRPDRQVGGGRKAGRSRPAAKVADAELTESENRVLRLLRCRLTLKEIGDELYLSVNTVKTHTKSIYRKLGVSSRAQVIELLQH